MTIDQTSPAKGRLHLIPTGLGATAHASWLPEGVRQLAAELDLFIAENARTARAFLKHIGTVHALQDITIHTLNARVAEQTLHEWLNPLAQGRDIGLVSEAGCPAIADPGARLVEHAHQRGFTVVPHVGPSSILLGLMASGLDGQRFSFHGYAPVKAAARAAQLKAWEAISRRERQTQILIETPYRNEAMFVTLLQTLQPQTRLCIARALTTPDEWIMTRRIGDWKNAPRPELARLPTLFLFQAN